ncbi:MAG: ribonuclease III [Oscillospiraceae bacterium]|nr:ribonuclease III [Oscillospiraceae bacterium]
MTKLEQTIGYAFQNDMLRRTAMTHSSYYNENRAVCKTSNERLEFLGDSVLGFLTAEYLYDAYPDKSEGELTKLRAALVCEARLAGTAADIGLNEALLLGRGEEVTGGRRRASLTADAVEALLAAIFLDGGMEPARRFVRRFLLVNIPERSSDYKTALQELLQRDPPRNYAYHLVETAGPDHAKRFTVEVRMEGKPLGRGVGGSKKEAEQAAAQAAIRLLEADGHAKKRG